MSDTAFHSDNQCNEFWDPLVRVGFPFAINNVMKNNVYIGWDKREEIAYEVCKKSIAKLSVNTDVFPIKQQEFGDLYTRPVDPLSSTEFTFTRFLVPALMNYNGWALFMDCDCVLLEDIQNLFSQVDDRYAVMCAKHDYTPKATTKMNGAIQHQYPRKNWSSVVLFNCSHPKNKILTPELISDTNTTGKYLHRFSWLDDSEIGTLSHEWNWLVGWYEEPEDGSPKLLHYTEGGPWFERYKDCEYADKWISVANTLK